MIKLKNLNKYYNKGKSNEIHVINNTTLTLGDTGLVCILGESGSGKTTLMNTVSGLDDFHDGIIEVDGVAIDKFGNSSQEMVRNAKFGYIFQNYYLLQDRTVEYNIMLALSMYEISDEEKAQRIDYVLKAVDMWRYKKRLVSQLSGGQQQRVAIARALAKAPKVIFADEPTGNLDEANTMRIMSILKKISKNCLVVVVTHEKSIADFFADRILWISDGKIENEVEKQSQGSYQYVEDTNIYLQEYEKESIHKGNITLEIYSNGENELPLQLKVICENGKLYLYADGNPQIEFLGRESEKQVIDSKKPVIEMTDVDDIDYELEYIEGAKKPKISFREIWDIAKSNIRALGKKQVFLIFTLFIMSVLIVLAVQDIMVVLNVDKQTIVTQDSHYYTLSAKKDAMITDTEYKDYFTLTTTGLLEAGFDLNIVPVVKLLYQYSGFTQLENVEFEMDTYSMVDVAKITEKDLIYGRMPENDSEIVIDEWVIENFIANSGEISNIITNVKQVLGNSIVTDNNIELKIVGISRTEQPNIYLDKDILILFSRNSVRFLTQEKAEEQYSNFDYTETLEIDEDGVLEVLVPEDRLQQMYRLELKQKCVSMERMHDRIQSYEEQLRYYEDGGDSYGYWLSEDKVREELEKAKKELKKYEEQCGMTYEEYQTAYESENYKTYTYEDTITSNLTCKVVGYYPKEYELDFIIPDDACQTLAKAIMDTYKICNIYIPDTKEKKTTEDIKKEIMEAIPADAGEVLTINIVNQYEDELQAFIEENDEKSSGRNLITITIFIISMVILYFIMKANAIARMQDLGVYRMLGISKNSIIAMFACENFMITSYTSLIGAVGTTIVTYVFSCIPSLQVSINFPWYVFVLTLLFLYASNIIVGVMPIRKMLKLPPAQLAAKYDI